MNKENVFYATGKRKTAIARTWLKPGNGEIIVNDRPVNDYFKYESARTLAIQPFKITNTSGSYDVKIHVMGEVLQGRPERYGTALPEPYYRSILTFGRF